MRSTAQEFNISAVFSAASSYNNRITINGCDIYTGRVINALDLPLVASAIYMMAYKTKYNTGQLMKIFSDTEKDKRSSTSLSLFDFFVRLIRSVKAGSSATPENGVVVIKYAFPILSELLSKTKGSMDEWKKAGSIAPCIDDIGTTFEIHEMLTIVAEEHSIDLMDYRASVENAITVNNLAKQNYISALKPHVADVTTDLSPDPIPAPLPPTSDKVAPNVGHN